MKFSEALEVALAGEAIARRTAFAYERIYLVKGSIAVTARSISDNLGYAASATGAIQLRYFEAGDADTATRLPRFDAKDIHENTFVGWTPTLSDMLADDWDLVEVIKDEIASIEEDD